MGARLSHLAVALLVAWSLSACQANSPAGISQGRVEEIEALWATLPLHTSFSEVKKPSFSRDGSPRFGPRYAASAPYDEVRRFYIEGLARSGWQFVREGELKDRGRIRGERLLEFRKDGYELAIKYSGERKRELGWVYRLKLSRPSE
jgi:hypothetical protein